jgi:predicted nucleic acid-binding protein
MPSPFLLDTTVLLHWTRNSTQAQAIDTTFQLSSSLMRPLVCEVSLGEMLAFSLSLKWGAQKRRRLAEIERHVVVVDISDPRVRQSYAELSTLAQTSGWSIFHGKNDLWVGAAANAADGHLLTMDMDFLPLRGRAGWQITILDDRTGLPRP